MHILDTTILAKILFYKHIKHVFSLEDEDITLPFYLLILFTLVNYMLYLELGKEQVFL